MEKFAQRHPTCIHFDDQIQKYTIVQKEIAKQPPKKEVEFVLLHLEPLARSLQDNARQWILSLGKLLNTSASEELKNLLDELQVQCN